MFIRSYDPAHDRRSFPSAGQNLANIDIRNCFLKNLKNEGV